MLFQYMATIGFHLLALSRLSPFVLLFTMKAGVTNLQVDQLNLHTILHYDSMLRHDHHAKTCSFTRTQNQGTAILVKITNKIFSTKNV